MKLVSVIIPAYNHEKYIKACLESVINQTYQKLEIIVQDDCSTDGTAEEIKKIKDDRIKAVFSKKNQGVVDTLNDLLDMCHGDYIATIGSDDIWHPTKIEKQVAFLEKHPEMGGVFTTANIIDEDGNIYDDDDFSSDIFRKDNMTQSERMKVFFENGNHLCHSSSLLTKKVVKKIGKYNRAYRQLHDYDYWTRLINEYNIYVLDEKLTNYRRARKGNKSVSCSSDKNSIRVLNEIYTINSNMVLKSKNDIFLEMLDEEIKYKTSMEILCRKYLFLIKDKNSAYKLFAFRDIYDSSEQEKFFEIFKKKFNYTLNDFYKDTGKIINIYPIDFLEEYNKQVAEKNELLERLDEFSKQLETANKVIEEMNDSRSWKVTAPLRKISKILKKEG